MDPAYAADAAAAAMASKPGGIGGGGTTEDTSVGSSMGLALTLTLLSGLATGVGTCFGARPFDRVDLGWYDTPCLTPCLTPDPSSASCWLRTPHPARGPSIVCFDLIGKIRPPADTV